MTKYAEYVIEVFDPLFKNEGWCNFAKATNNSHLKKFARKNRGYFKSLKKAKKTFYKVCKAINGYGQSKVRLVKYLNKKLANNNLKKSKVVVLQTYEQDIGNKIEIKCVHCGSEYTHYTNVDWMMSDFLDFWEEYDFNCDHTNIKDGKCLDCKGVWFCGLECKEKYYKADIIV
jgi:hypothetical protein